MKRFLLFFAFCVISSITVSAQKKFPYQDASLPIDQRVDDLIGRMTFEEDWTTSLHTGMGLLFHTG